MMKLFNHALKVLSVILFGLALASCTDTDGPPEEILGIAETGSATHDTVYVVDSMGMEISKTINADGFFRLDVRGMTAPFMLKTVDNEGIDTDLYSYVAEENIGVNVTPLTNLAMVIAYGDTDLASLYSSWASSFELITALAIKDAQATINANLVTQYTAFSLDSQTYDFFEAQFLTNGTSIDGLLNAMSIDLSSGISISIAGIVDVLVFDSNIDITSFDIGGVAVAALGAYTLDLEGSIGGIDFGGLRLAINLSAADVPTAPSGNIQIVQDTFLSFYGLLGDIVINSVDVTVTVDEVTFVATTVAVITATITTLDNGDVIYVATYSYNENI